MAKKYRKRTARSRRPSSKQQKRCDAKVTESGVQLLLPIAEGPTRPARPVAKMWLEEWGRDAG